MAPSRRSSAPGAEHLELVPEGSKSAGDRHALAITALRARIDEEFRVTERLDSKARQTFALVGGAFAVVQTVTFGSFAAEQLTGVGRLVTMLLALIAGSALAMTARKVMVSEDLRWEQDISPTAIEDWAKTKDDVAFARAMVVHLRAVAEARAQSNARRAETFRGHRGVLFWSRWTLLLAVAEFIAGICFRS